MTTQQYRPAQHRPPTQSHSPVVEKVMTLVTPIEPKAMMALRAFTYVVCSVAAITFLIVVLYVNNKVTQFQESMQNLFGGPSATSSPFNTSPGKPFGN